MRDILKVYPNGVRANDHVNFSVLPQEIHALVGENGAGKSTLMKILYGMERPTAGQIFVRGKPVTIHSPHEAIALGIGMVHQNFMLVPSFTIAENVVLGAEPVKRGLLDFKAAVEATRQLSEQYGLAVDPEAVVEAVPVGIRQRVEILKALYRGADVLILDEPTAVLTPQETHELFAAIRNLVRNGKTVIFISHKLREVKAISDRVSVMRNARMVDTVNTREVSEDQIARMMVGREVFLHVDKPRLQRGEVVLQVRDLEYVTEAGVETLKGVSFNVYAGEILGIAGVEGNGQTELVEVITGLRRAAAGRVRLCGKDITNASPRQVRLAGVAHIPEDRLTNGAALEASIADNLIVDRYERPPFTRGGLLQPAAIAENAETLIDQFAIRAPDGSLLVGSLSGGNMQKVILARELSSRPKLLVAAQPTRGVDIGASEFIYEQLVQARNNGVAVLLVSADLNEVMSLADRILVMKDGEVTAIFPEVAALSEEEIGYYMLGVKHMPRETLAERM
ncbi:MAG: ABC transporter ATP-binding protein [Anaerolineae bacterium]|nr:ABC transporter ATP-binding protein [Thermoflexales bacterium]MDW8396594.1 ABC transporter ATP-binding protein [Anaerolineae bacterium]